MKRTGQAKFNVGQLVRHKLFDYRGVIFDVDLDFQGSNDWYEQVAKSRPPKNQPWYHVLVHDGIENTYVAERNLESDISMAVIDHPLVSEFFSKFENGVYVPTRSSN